MAEGSRLHALCSGADDPLRLSHFWAGVLGWEPADDPHDGSTLLPRHRAGQQLPPKFTWGGPPLMPGADKGRLHFDLAPSVHGGQRAEIDRLVSLGATRVGLGRAAR
ncbi:MULTISPECIES: VOC family protein [unclassified Streptomyces]|uniref:VOC family protein n=1 Tax=Streptomyces sp. NPDC127532 TaxID=3345399 RepID=UPI003631D475